MLIVWDSYSGIPVRMFLNPHPNGVLKMDLSADDLYIATLGADLPQTISIWDWTDESKDGPIASLKLQNTDLYKTLYWIKFNPSDPHEFATNADDRVSFMKWTEASGTISYYSPNLSKKEFANQSKHQQSLTKTVFLPGTEKAVTGTEGGDILVWEVSKIKTGIGQPGERKLEKVVILNNDNFNKVDFISINILLTVGQKYLVCGNADGTIRFYDFNFKAAAWFEEQDLSTIKSISFSNKNPTRADGEDDNKIRDYDDRTVEMSSDFACSDFLVADSNGFIAELKASMYEAIDKNERKAKTLWSGIKSPVSAIAVHPTMSVIAVATDDGFIGIYDYLNNFENKSYLPIPMEEKKDDKAGGKDEKPKAKAHMTPEERAALREKLAKSRLITCMEFTPIDGDLLVCLNTGEIKLVDGQDFKLVPMTQPLRVTEEQNIKDSQNAIKQITVTQDGKYFATSDIRNTVCLFKYGHYNDDENQEITWFFNGKIMSHTVEITSICFGMSLDENDQMQHRLFSIGKDRKCFEYNVATSRIDTKLSVEREFTIELESYPTACIWYPGDDSKESLILTANDEYKMKLWNPTACNSRRTCLGPTYGGEIIKLKCLD